MIMTLITGLIGIALLVTFLGIMVWWVKALPLIIIVVGVLVLLLIDFVQELRAESNSAGSGPLIRRCATPTARRTAPEGSCSSNRL